MRTLPLFLVLIFLAGCQAAVAPVAIGLGGPVAAFGRSPIDMVASVVTGRDCSVVRLDRRQSYCAEAEQAPAPEPFCTMSLGRADCWTVPPLAYPAHVPVGDGNRPLTAAQEAHRTRFGPGLSLPDMPPVQPVAIMAPAALPPAAPPPEAAPVRMDPIPDPPARPAARPRRPAVAPAAAPAVAPEPPPADATPAPPATPQPA